VQAHTSGPGPSHRLCCGMDHGFLSALVLRLRILGPIGSRPIVSSAMATVLPLLGAVLLAAERA
jgi:hypothetical protein